MGVKERESNYSDYGIDDAELKELLLLIRNDSDSQALFLNCCRTVRPEIANDLYYSFTGHVSYDDLKMIKCVPLPKTDFYAYRRKAVAEFKTKIQPKNVINKPLAGQLRFEDIDLNAN